MIVIEKIVKSIRYFMGWKKRYNIISSDQDLKEWIDFEQPYEFFTSEDKKEISKIGTSLNNCIRKGYNLNFDKAFNRFKCLIKYKKLKNSLVVFRGQESIEYEKGLAKNHGLNGNYLYYNAFVYTSLNEENYYYHTNIRMKIYIPAGTKYLFTGKYSNTPDSNELVLDVGTILKIINMRKKKKVTYITAIVIDQYLH